MTASRRVLIADDHAPARSALRHALESDGFLVCGEAADADGAVLAARREAPDICVLAVGMSGGGIRAAREIVKWLPEVPVVMLTGAHQHADLLDSLQAGVMGYLLEDTDPKRLGSALRGVLSGEAAVPRILIPDLLDEFRSRGNQRRSDVGAAVSEREWEVLDLVRQGRSTAEAAERLAISPVTVRRHIQSVLRKLGAPNRQAAIALINDGTYTRPERTAATAA